MVANCMRNRLQQKDYVETLRAMEMLLLKAFLEKDLGHELQQMFLFFSSDLDKFKLEAQPKTLTRIVNEKQVGIKGELKIISPINSSQKLLLSEVLQLAQLILIVPVSNAVSEGLFSRIVFKTYLRSFTTQERLRSCLILTSYTKKVDKLKLADVANQFCFEN